MNEELEQPFLKCRESGSRWQSRILETDTARVPRPSPKHAHVTLELVFVTAKQSNVPPTHTHPTHAPSPIHTTFTAPLSHALCWGWTGAVLVSVAAQSPCIRFRAPGAFARDLGVALPPALVGLQCLHFAALPLAQPL